MSLTWPAKHPAAVADYVWIVGIDAGDTIATASITVTDGTVIASARTPKTGDTTLVADVSGGTIGETNVLYAVVTTAGGRTFDETIYLPVVASASTDPNVATLKMRYPAFSAVADETVEYWLTDAQRYVATSWSEGDYAPGLIAIACHEMIGHKVAGVADGELQALLAAGVTDFQSGGREGFRVSFSDAAIKDALSSEYAATVPGQEYTRLLRRNVSTMGVSAPGQVPCYGYPYRGIVGNCF